jgi:hypothetical protein
MPETASDSLTLLALLRLTIYLLYLNPYPARWVRGHRGALYLKRDIALLHKLTQAHEVAVAIAQ